MMASFFPQRTLLARHREIVDVRICAGRGRAHVRFTQPSLGTNPFRTLFHSMSLPLRRHSPGPRQATAGAARNSSTLRRPLFPVFVRGDTPNSTGFLNLFGLVKATRSLFGALVQACKQSSCRLCVSLCALRSLFIHADEPKRRTVENARIESGEIRNVMR